jgi:hypothetical protein
MWLPGFPLGPQPGEPLPWLQTQGYGCDTWCLRDTEKIKDVKMQGGILQDLHDVIYIYCGKILMISKNMGGLLWKKTFTNIGLVMRGQITFGLITINLVSDNIYHGLVFKILL